MLSLILYITAVYSTLNDGNNLFDTVLVIGGGVGTVMVGLTAIIAVIYNNKALAIFVSLLGSELCGYTRYLILSFVNIPQGILSVQKQTFRAFPLEDSENIAQ